MAKLKHRGGVQIDVYEKQSDYGWVWVVVLGFIILVVIKSCS